MFFLEMMNENKCFLNFTYVFGTCLNMKTVIKIGMN